MKKIYIFIFGLILLNSCEDFLDEYPPQSITSGNFYKNEKELVMAANSVYNRLYSVWGAGSLPYLYGDLYGGDSWIYLTVGTAGDWEDLGDNMNVFPANGVITGAWNNYYRGIFLVNDFLDELEIFGVIETPGLGERLKAEALFVRSCLYYYLAQCYGDVPLITQVLTPQEALDLTQTPESEVIAQVEEDLKFAISNLPASYSGSDLGRVTSYAAKGMLARVYMAYGKNSEAQTELADIINSDVFTLDGNGDGDINNQDYSHVFDAYTKNSPECVFELQFIHGITGYNHNYANSYTPRITQFHLPGQTDLLEAYGNGAVEDRLFLAFEADDSVRRDISAAQYVSDLSGGDPIFCPHTTKYYHGYKETFNNGSNVPIIRFSEILLNMSEVTGDAQYLNRVRARAGLPGFGEAGYPAEFTTLTLALEHERRVEFSFEFQRGFDLKRTGRFLEVKSQELGKTLEPWRIHFPIPETVLDVNTEMTQNDGY